MNVSTENGWLDVDFDDEHVVLSWAIVGGGFTHARRVSWRKVSNSDLPEGRDPIAWLCDSMARRTKESQVVLMTSRQIETHRKSTARVGSSRATTLATAGLSNAMAVGGSASLLDESAHPNTGRSWGTINLLCQISEPLSQPAMIEALSIATEARTLAIIKRGILVGGEIATGTGTDCIAIACPRESTGQIPYAGKYTSVGQAIGRSVLDAVGKCTDEWLQERRARLAIEETA